MPVHGRRSDTLPDHAQSGWPGTIGIVGFGAVVLLVWFAQRSLIYCAMWRESVSHGCKAGGAPRAATAGSSAGTVVPHETLLTFLPVVPGLTKGEPQGETDTAESVSRVQAMLEPMLAMIKPGYVQNEGIATTKATAIAGFPAYEEWATDSKNGTIGVLAVSCRTC